MYLVAGGGGPSASSIPKAKQSPPLEEAKADGIISGYRVVPGLYGTSRYVVIGGDIEVMFPGACGNRSCPGSTPVIQILYRHAAQEQARQILELTRMWATRTFKPPLVNGPPDYRWHREGPGFILKFFEFS
jgi:hypothetical protein